MNECLLCGQPMKSTLSWSAFIGLSTDAKLCPSCSNSFERADNNKEGSLFPIFSLYTYNEAMQTYLHQLKFLQDVALADVFAHELRQQLRNRDKIVVIPMHPARKRLRTFSPVEELLTRARIPFLDLLEKTDQTVMGTMTKEERIAVPTLFTLKRDVTIQPTTYTLFDDITTTGTTLQHAAKVLRDAGATSVQAVTLIRAERND